MSQLIDKLQSNFEEVEPSLSHQEAFEEASRCLYCYDAPCITACPTGIDIPSYIKKIMTGNLRGSAKTIMEANPVGASCARVCPTEELCEGACVLNGSTQPILIGKLQRYATDWAIHNQKVLFKAGESNGKSVAIIGGGPGGLSAARELAVMGYSVTIFEADEEAGGLDTYGIVSFRLPKRISFWEVDQVKKVGVEIKTNTHVGTDITIEQLKNDYDAVVIAIGMSDVPQLGIPGEELDGVYDAIDFIKRTKTGKLPEEYVGKKGVVIGAGNTAIDGATCSIRLGADNVKILYRRSEEEMTAYDFEYEFAKQDKVEFRWLTAPKAIIADENGKVSAIECVKMELGELGEDRRRKPIPVPDSTFTIEVDFVIKAIGQSRFTELLEKFGIEHESGVVKLEVDSFETSVENVFACGDVMFGKNQGEAMVVTAAEQGKQTAYQIHHKLSDMSAEHSA